MNFQVEPKEVRSQEGPFKLAVLVEQNNKKHRASGPGWDTGCGGEKAASAYS